MCKRCLVAKLSQENVNNEFFIEMVTIDARAASLVIFGDFMNVKMRERERERKLAS